MQECVRTLLLGFGNELAGDDAVGLVVVRAVTDCLADDQVDIEETSESFLVLFDYLQRYQRIVVVDAVLGDRPQVGEVRPWHCASIGSPASASAGSHGMGLDSVMGLARAAGCEPLASVTLVGIGIGYQPAPREGLSRKVRAAVPKAVAAVLHEIRRSQGAFARENDLVAGQEMRTASGLT